MDRDRDRMAKQHARNADAYAAVKLARAPRDPIYRVIDGVEYEILWDGA